MLLKITPPNLKSCKILSSYDFFNYCNIVSLFITELALIFVIARTVLVKVGTNCPSLFG